MPSVNTLAVSFVILAQVVLGKGGTAYERYGIGKQALYACQAQVTQAATFGQSMGHHDSSPICISWAGRATMAGCYHLADRFDKSTIEPYIESCAFYNVTLTYQDMEEAYENYTKYAKDTTKIEGYNSTVMVDYPVILNSTLVEMYKIGYKNFLGNYDDSFYYGTGMISFWALVFLLAAVTNWSKELFPSVTKFFVGPISNAWRKYITIPALGRRKKTNEQKFLKAFDFIVPSRMETLIILAFLLITGLCNGLGIHYQNNDPIFESRRMALLRYTADRTGITTGFIMPLLILFAGRNNFLQWLTKWNYATFITYHRWVSRVAVILVIVHSCAFSVTFGSDYKREMKENYLVHGALATTAGGVILFQGMLFLRRRWYEIFLLLHIALAGMFVGGAWVHVQELGYVYWYYAAAAVWCFDRAVRVGRLVVFGCPKSDVILLADETLKVIVPRPKYWKPIPGGHAFVHFMRPSCFWQSHPFTFTENCENEDSIVLYCKIKGGVTHGLYQYLATHPGKTTKIRVAIEGPYGESTPAKRFDSAVFITGGNGIPGIYSEVYDLSRRSKDNSKQSLKLMWVVREYRSLYWFYEELLALKQTRINTTIYITKPDSHANLEDFNNRVPLVRDLIDLAQTTEDLSNDEKGSMKEKILADYDSNEESDCKEKIIRTIKAELSHITFKEGRPDMEQIVKEEVAESLGSTAFITCGHPVMVDDLRYAVSQSLDNGGKRVDFFEQLQVWA